MTSPIRTNRGFTLIETMMVILLVGILSVVSLDLISNNLNESRFQATAVKLKQIQVAMLGDPTIFENNSRTSFGYLGDIGALPTAAYGIAALVANPGFPAYAASSTTRIGLGWNGPYLSGQTTDYTNDGWGNAFVYSPTASPPTLVSLGSDGAAGGTGFAQDQTITLATTSTVATVQGFICSRGGPFTAAASVELNFPNGAGVLTQSLVTVTTANAGYFSFSNVPFGVRSITIYQPSKAAATSTLGPVILTIDKPNYLVPCNAIDVNP